MAGSLVQYATAHCDSSHADPLATLPNNVQVGNIVIFIQSVLGGFSYTTTGTATLATIHTLNNGFVAGIGPGGNGLYVRWALVTGAGSLGVSVHGIQDSDNMIVHAITEWTGLLASSTAANDTSGAGNGGTGSGSAGAGPITTTQEFDLLLMLPAARFHSGERCHWRYGWRLAGGERSGHNERPRSGFDGIQRFS